MDNCLATYSTGSPVGTPYVAAAAPTSAERAQAETIPSGSRTENALVLTNVALRSRGREGLGARGARPLQHREDEGAERGSEQIVAMGAGDKAAKSEAKKLLECGRLQSLQDPQLCECELTGKALRGDGPGEAKRGGNAFRVDWKPAVNNSVPWKS
ncbi:hypothetical protein AXG93_1162s1030 [Marchantia polymorpha subsp. ruderalis]|uniref:Uncharacterized protein n=1 Tax=Marchantia polymorpha subsp. ruderalis TaxID=1480154 RepID=A0A176WQ42_MARPO|nr:hypothetical protein AXG93_1162s1030 [Marchantia polymorpha subsp. ruderalis]